MSKVQLNLDRVQLMDTDNAESRKQLVILDLNINKIKKEMETKKDQQRQLHSEKAQLHNNIHECNLELKAKKATMILIKSLEEKLEEANNDEAFNTATDIPILQED